MDEDSAVRPAKRARHEGFLTNVDPSHSSSTNNGEDVNFNPETAAVETYDSDPPTGEMLAPMVVDVGLREGGWFFFFTDLM